MAQKIASLYAEIGADTSKFQKGARDTKTGLAGLKQGFDGFLKVTAAVAGGMLVAKKAFDQTVGVTVEYNKQIRELTQVTGAGAEELSRIVQVGDDWGITIDDLRTSLSMMNKNGMAPTIDNLAKLADEYVNTTDKTAFAEKASRLLGRQYTTLIPLLAKGGKAFRDQAAAIDDSLLATDESITASREYEVALDNMNDKVNALQLSIGMKLVPKMTLFLTLLEKMMSLDAKKWFQDGANASADFINGFFGLGNGAQAASMGLSQFRDIVKELYGPVTDANGAVDGSIAVYDAAKAKLSEYNIKLKNQVDLEKELALLTGEITQEDLEREKVLGFLTKQLDMGNLSAQQYLEILGKMASGAYTLEEAIKAITAAINGMPLSKTVTIKLNYVNPAAGEPGPDVPVVIPGGGNEGNYGGKKAGGGPVMAGMSYLVGEQGPELFTPGRSGGITPNNAMGGDVFADITINAAPGMDVNAVAAAVVARLNTARRVQSSGGAYRGV